MQLPWHECGLPYLRPGRCLSGALTASAGSRATRPMSLHLSQQKSICLFLQSGIALACTLICPGLTK